MLHRIRLAMQDEVAPKLGGPEGGPVEVDEAYIGGEAKNKHGYRKTKRSKFIKDAATGRYVPNPDWATNRGRGTEKVPVFGMLDREARKVRAHVIPNVKREALMDSILNNVQKGGTVYSDSFPAYTSLAQNEFIHETVNHLKEYVRGEVHTNGIENFWSLLKRSLKGTYVSVEPFHLDRYVDEQVFRFNNRGSKDRKITDYDRFDKVVRGILGRRLTFAELTGKVESAEAF
jgi:transposase-like protein